MVSATPQHAPPTHADEQEHRRLLALRANGGLPKAGGEPMVAPLILQSVAVADVPAAADHTGGMIYVSDEVGGAVPAFSDGTNWRRCTDRVIVS